jgi:hypothetical protein
LRTFVVRRSGHEGYTHITENGTELTPPLLFESCLKSPLTIRFIGSGGRSVVVLIPSTTRDAFFGWREQEDQLWRVFGVLGNSSEPECGLCSARPAQSHTVKF